MDDGCDPLTVDRVECYTGCYKLNAFLYLTSLCFALINELVHQRIIDSFILKCDYEQPSFSVSSNVALFHHEKRQ